MGCGICFTMNYAPLSLQSKDISPRGKRVRDGGFVGALCPIRHAEA